MRRLIALIILVIILVIIGRFASNFAPRTLQQQGTLMPGGETDEKVKVLSYEDAVVNVVKKAGPSVVTIAATLTVDQRNLFEDDPFSFFGIPQPRRETPNEPRNIGSGFIISRDGIIVTNKHVVSDASVRYTVVTVDEKRYNVERIYRDPLNDIALLKVNANNLTPLQLGDSSKLQVGQLAIAIGTPLGEFNNTVTTGVISGLGRGITAGSVFEGYVEQLDNVIQTDAAINPGNSGGPLLNASGQVIGINTAVSQSGQNLGFAIPINTVRDSLDTFNETGQFNRPFMGISYRMISREVALRNEVPEGAFIEEVVPDSAADKAGIQSGDIITKFDGQNVRSRTNELAALIGKKKIGDTVAIEVWREDESGNEERVQLRATLENAPSE
jgi:serine protease Do